MRPLALLAAGLIALAPGLAGPTKPLALPDPDGKSHPLVGPKGATFTVVLFSSGECPKSQAALETVTGLAGRYADRGIAFRAVYPNALEKPSALRKLAFPSLLDADQQAADAFNVKVTPTAIVLDAAGKVRYRGAVESNSAERKAVRTYLADALDALLAGREPEAAETTALGCAVERKLAEADAGGVTYANAVGAILHKHCAACHRPGQAGPFPLLTYEQALRKAHSIKAVTQAHTMPPWKPINHGAFRNERVMSSAEIDALARWVDGGAPLGDPLKAPAPPKFAEGWQLGTPDLVLEMPEYRLDPEGRDEYRCFSLDPKLADNAHVRAVEFLPGNPKVVHHVMTYIDGLGITTFYSGKDGKPGYPSDGTGPGFMPVGDLGGWGPGTLPAPLPDGTARYLPKGARVVMEVHYHKSGREEKDRTKLGIYFARGPVTKKVYSQVVINLRFRIPAGADRHEVQADWTVPEDIHVLSVQPHMHLIGKEIRLTAEPPEKPEGTMIHLKDWDFNWQQAYEYAKPVALAKGTKVRLSGWFDNSDGNLNNPNRPPRDVKFGLQTTDEMCVAYLLYTKDAEK